MVRRLLILFILLMGIFQACEDKKTNAENTTSEADKQTISSSKTAPSNQMETEKKKEKEAVRGTDTISGQLIVQEELIPFLTKYGKENPENMVRISTKFGDIDVRLFNDTPLHRANFLLLTKLGYFDETYFHRVDEGFVIQGGNSDNASTNQKRYKIGSYLIPNEYTNRHPHVRGAFSAAKYSEQNVSNASSPYEFFIVQSQNGAHHLDGDHTVFGEVVRGMEVVDEIAKQPTDEGEWPIRNIELQAEILN